MEAQSEELQAVRRAVAAANHQIGNSCLPIDSTDYGFNFQEAVLKSHLPKEVVSGVKEGCQEFLIHLCSELISRMPNNFAVIKKLKKYFLPKNIFARVNKLPVDKLPLITAQFLLQRKYTKSVDSTAELVHSRNISSWRKCRCGKERQCRILGSGPWNYWCFRRWKYLQM